MTQLRVPPHVETNPRHLYVTRAQESGSPPSSPLNEPILEPRQVDDGGTGDATRTLVQSRLPGYDTEPTCRFISSPPRHDDLIDEINFIQLKAAEDRVEVFKACPTFDAYLTTVQKDAVRPRHRHIVFEWILKIGDKSMLQLNTKALHYAFYYFDRYLSLIKVAVNQLQLVATACVWVSSKVCSDQVPVGLASQLCQLVGGIEPDELIEMEKWLLASLHYRLHPVISLDSIRLLLPYVDLPASCRPREQKRRLFEQYVENISLAQSLVYPLLKYPQAILAISAVVCGAHLISGRSGAGTGGGKGKIPETMKAHESLDAKLSKQAGVSVQETRACRREMLRYINLESLVEHMQPAVEASQAEVEPKLSVDEKKREREKRLREKTSLHLAKQARRAGMTSARS